MGPKVSRLISNWAKTLSSTTLLLVWEPDLGKNSDFQSVTFLMGGGVPTKVPYSKTQSRRLSRPISASDSCSVIEVRRTIVFSDVVFLLAHPIRYQGYAGTLQVTVPVSKVCRYPTGTLTGIRGMQVPDRYSDRYLGYAGI